MFFPHWLPLLLWRPKLHNNALTDTHSRWAMASSDFQENVMVDMILYCCGSRNEWSPSYQSPPHRAAATLLHGRARPLITYNLNLFSLITPNWLFLLWNERLLFTEGLFGLTSCALQLTEWESSRRMWPTKAQTSCFRNSFLLPFFTHHPSTSRLMSWHLSFTPSLAHTPSCNFFFPSSSNVRPAGVRHPLDQMLEILLPYLHAPCPTFHTEKVEQMKGLCWTWG